MNDINSQRHTDRQQPSLRLFRLGALQQLLLSQRKAEEMLKLFADPDDCPILPPNRILMPIVMPTPMIAEAWQWQ